MTTILLILFAHFVSDFLFQTDKQAINKSTSNWWLTQHVITYTIGLSFFMAGHLAWHHQTEIIYWLLINAGLHWITDYATSRINSYLWRKEMRHWFFVGIGADQFIHYTCLLLTYDALIK